MHTQERLSSSHLKTKFRFDLVTMAVVALFSIFLVFLLDTGSLAQWIANHKQTKIDEIVFFGSALLLVAGLLALRKWLGISRLVERYNDAVELSPEISRVKHAQKRDLFGVALALGVSLVLVFFFDTGSIAEWIAQHKESKVDETIVTGLILLIGLLFFSVRRWLELTEQVLRYATLHKNNSIEPGSHAAGRTRRISPVMSIRGRSSSSDHSECPGSVSRIVRGSLHDRELT